MIKRILVATDGSDHADHALKYAVKTAEKWDAKLIIISVTPPIKPIFPDPDGFYPGYTPEYENELEEAYKKILDESVKKIQKEKPDINIEKRLEKGRPSDIIVKVAKMENAGPTRNGKGSIG